jgi:hypothetical protein
MSACGHPLQRCNVEVFHPGWDGPMREIAPGNQIAERVQQHLNLVAGQPHTGTAAGLGFGLGLGFRGFRFQSDSGRGR